MMASSSSIRESLELGEKIGAGAFATVYRAHDRTNGKTVAVKKRLKEAHQNMLTRTVKVRLDDSLCDLEACRREVLLLTRVDSPFIVKIYGAQVTGLELWIVMEYMGVGSCEDLLKSNTKIPEPALARILFCAVQGLVYLHEHGQIHRDIKPANILVAPTGDVKLCDLGVSFDVFNDSTSSSSPPPSSSAASRADGGDGRAAGAHTDPRSWLPQRKQRASRVPHGADLDNFTGTPKYMAPEAISQQANTPLSDVWSLGISTIEMATGVCPHGDVNPLRAMMLTRDEPPPTLDRAGGYSKTLIDFVTRCLQKNPADRMSAAELAKHKLIKGKPKGSKLKKCIEKHMAYVERGKADDSGSDDEEDMGDRRDDHFQWTFT